MVWRNESLNIITDQLEPEVHFIQKMETADYLSCHVPVERGVLCCELEMELEQSCLEHGPTVLFTKVLLYKKYIFV